LNHLIAKGNGKTLGYIRVSTDEQNPQRQLEGAKLDKVFIEYASGSSTDRYQLKLLQEYVREDDVLIVHSMDRLARNCRNLLALVEFFAEKKVTVQFIKENLVFGCDDSPVSKLILTIMGAVAEFELHIIKERQMEGIKIAQRKGLYKGRQTVLTPERLQLIHDAFKTRKSIERIAEDVGISRETLYRYIRRLIKEGNIDVLNFQRIRNITVNADPTNLRQPQEL